MQKNENISLIVDYKKVIQRIKETVKNVSIDCLDFRAEKDHWTIREHIAHVLDSEIYGFVRYRKSIADIGSTIEGYNEELLRANLDYASVDVGNCIEVIGILNNLTTNHLLEIVDKDWDEYYVKHPERGKNTLKRLVHLRINHVKEHIKYIERNLNLSKKD